jgi:S1-C subfamily serine protease
MPRNVPGRVTFLLFFLFFLGLTLNVLAFVDLHWTNWLLAPRKVQVEETRSDDPGEPVPQDSQVKKLRESILNVRAAQCGPDGGENVGTGFVVKPGYVATAAHIIGDQQSCGGKLRLIDFKGREHPASLDGLSVADDLAVLRISDTLLPALAFADSTAYETPNEVVTVVTIGYPLEGSGASAQDSAGISNEGSLSRYDRENNVFITSGLNLNSGNSGGPVFLRNNWKVIGIAQAKVRSEVGEGIGYVAPIRTFQNFFREKTGQELP